MMMKTCFVSAVVLAFVSSSWAYSEVGCFDDDKDRILEGKFTVSADMTVEKCVQICSLEGDYFAGVEYGGQCYCGKTLKEYAKHGKIACSMACAGDKSQKCGGFWKIFVYTTNVNYLGCYEDNKERILEGKSTNDNAMTTKMCLETCQNKGKRFALTEYSSQCFCGNHLKTLTKKPESDCSYTCKGNTNENCGGFWRGSLYLINYNAM